MDAGARVRAHGCRDCCRRSSVKPTFKGLGGNALAGIPLVVVHEGIKDNGQGKGFAFGDLRGEHAVAVMTPPKLDGFELFVAFAFFGNVGAPAVEAPFALLPDEALARIGHVFLVPRRNFLDKGTSWIVQLMGEYGLSDHAGMAPHGFCISRARFCL